jgi:cytochrome c
MTIRIVLLTLLFAAMANSATAQTAAEGKTAFTACAACHSIDGSAKPMGPTLKGIVGRKAASDPKYTKYSTGLKNSKITWTAAELDAYLKAPTAKVKGTSMLVATPDQKRRQSIIAYLKSLK